MFSYRDDAPKALERIRLSLSKFILGRNEAKKNSIESKLFEAVNNLIQKRKNNELDIRGLDELEFTNDMIFEEVETVIGGKRIEEKDSISSVEYGVISRGRIKGLYRSKLTAYGYTKRVPFIKGNDTETFTKRILRFSQESLDSLRLYYDVPKETKIVDITSVTKSVTHVTHVTHSEVAEGDQDTEKGLKSHVQKLENNRENSVDTTPESVTSVISVTERKQDMKVEGGNKAGGHEKVRIDCSHPGNEWSF